MWLNGKNTVYVREMEQQLEAAIANDKWKQAKRAMENENIFLPPHFFGELAKTVDGCKKLEQHKVVTLLLDELDGKRGGEEMASRAAVMGLCQIGGCELGLELIQNKYNNVVWRIVKLILSSPSLSMRAIAFMGVGLVSRTEKGEGYLKEMGFEKSQFSLLALPSNVLSPSTDFLTVPSYSYLGSWSQFPLYPFSSSSPPPHEDQVNYSAEEREIVRAIVGLCNQITTDIVNLKKLHTKNTKLFSTPKLLFAVLRVLATYNFRSQIRKYILNLFSNVVISISDISKMLYQKDRKL